MNPEIEEARKLAAGVDGWLHDEEGELLFTLAKNCQGRGAIVEIGSWKGKSTIWLGKGALAGKMGKIWAIDPHTGSEEHQKALGKVWTFDEFKSNIAAAGLESIVIPVVDNSSDAAANFKDPVELIFIDGAHDYSSVRIDFEAWFPKLMEGGTMAFHDTTYAEGPWRVVEENLYRSRHFERVRLLGSITYAKKVRRNSIGSRFRNSLAAYARRPPESIRRFLPVPVKSLARKIITAAGLP